MDSFEDREEDQYFDDDEVTNGDGGGQGSGKPLFSSEDQEELDSVRKTRIALMNELSKPGKLIPDSTGDKIMLMQLLDGREKAVIQKTRLKISAKTEENATNLTSMVAAVLLQTKVTRPEIQRPRELKLDNALKHSNPVPGMMEIGTVQVRYEDVVPKKE